MAYPTTNLLILNGLNAGQKYSYSIVAYGADNRSSMPVISAFATSAVPLLSAEQPTACADESVTLKGTCPTGWHVSWTWQQPQGPQTSLATVLTQPGPNTYQAVCIQNANGQVSTAQSVTIAPKNPVFCQPAPLSKADNYILWVNPSEAAAFAQVPRKSASNARTGSNTRGIFNVTMMFGPDDCWDFQVQVEEPPKSPSTTPAICVPFTIHKPLTDPVNPASGSGNVDVPGTGAYPPISDPFSNTPILNPSDPTTPSTPQTPEIPVLPRPQVPRPSTPCTNQGEDYVWTVNEYGYMGWVCKPMNLRNGARTASADAVVFSTTPSGSNTPCISFVIGDQEYRVTVLNKEPVPCTSTSEDFEKNLLVAFLEQQYPDIRYYGPPTNDTYLGLRDGFMELFDQALPAIAEGPQRQAQLNLYFEVLQYLVNGITDFAGATLTLTPESYSTLYELLTNKGSTEGIASALSQLLLQQDVNVEYARGKTDIAELSQSLQEIYTALQDVSPELQAQLWDYVAQHPGTGPLQALARFSVPEDTEPAGPEPLPAWVASVSYFNDLNRLATDGRRSSGNALVRMSDGRELKAYTEPSSNFVYLFDQENGVEYFNLNGHWVLRRYEQTEVLKYYDETAKRYHAFTPSDAPVNTNEILLRYGRGLAKFGYIWNLVVINTAGLLLGTGALISVEMATAAQLLPLYAATTDLTIINIGRYELEHLSPQTEALYEAYDGVMLYMSLVEMGTAAAATGHYAYTSYRQAKEFQLQQQQLAQRLADLRANPPATVSQQQWQEWERLTKRSGQAALDAVNHLESLKGVRTLFGAKGDEMTAGFLEQISQSNLTAEQIAGLTQNLDDYPWLLEMLNAKPVQIRTWTVKGGSLNFSSLIKSNLSKLGVSDDITKYTLASNSKGGAYILQDVSVEVKEIALADEVFNLTNQRCIFPKNNLQAIEGFLEDGTAFTMKELESNFNSFATRINEMSSKIKNDPNFQWIGAEGYLKVPFNSFTKTDGTIQAVTKQYVEQQFNAAIGRNAFTIKNDGTLKKYYCFPTRWQQF